MKVLLINLDYKYGFWSNYINPSLGYLAESLYANKIKYDVFDLTFNSVKKLYKKIVSYKPNILCFSMMSLNYKDHYKFFNELKKRFPKLKIIIGGSHVATFGKQILDDCKAVDILVFNEGEERLVKICNNILLKKIDNIAFRNKNEIIKTKPGKFIDNLDKLSFPKYRKFEINKYPDNSIPIVSSRGCPYSCTYCSSFLIAGKKVRVRSAKNVVDEIEYWYKKGYKHFTVTDDNFTFYKERVYEICDEIKKRKINDLKLAVGGIRADNIDSKLLKRMKEVGFKTLNIGVEAVSNRELRLLKKGETIEQIEKVIVDALSLKYSVTLYFLIGFPGQTIKDIKETLNFALKYPLADTFFSPIMPYPNTEMYRQIKEECNLFYEPKDYLNSKQLMNRDVIFTTKQISKKDWKYIKKEMQRTLGKIKFNNIRNRYKRFFPINYFIAYLISKHRIEKLFYRNHLLRKLRSFLNN